MSFCDYFGVWVLIDYVWVFKLWMCLIVLEVCYDLLILIKDGCISDFVNLVIINCIYGDVDVFWIIVLVGGLYVEYWLIVLDLLGCMYYFKVVMYFKMGCLLFIEEVLLIMGNNVFYL